MTIRAFRVNALFKEGGRVVAGRSGTSSIATEKRWRQVETTVTLQEARNYVAANKLTDYQIVDIATGKIIEQHGG